MAGNPFKAYEETINNLHMRLKDAEEQIARLLYDINHLAGEQYARASVYNSADDGSGTAGVAVQQVGIPGDGGDDSGELAADYSDRAKGVVTDLAAAGNATLVADEAGNRGYLANVLFAGNTGVVLNGEVEVGVVNYGGTAGNNKKGQLYLVHKEFGSAPFGDGKTEFFFPACVLV